MAFRELLVVEIKESLRQWMRGHGYRTVAVRVGLDRKTVRRYVEAAQALGLTRNGNDSALDDSLIGDVVAAVHPGAPSVPGAMREHCRAHAKQIEDWLDEGCKAPKVKRLLGRHTRVVVPLRTLQRFIGEDLDRGRKRGATVRVVDPEPGIELEVDFFKAGEFVELGSGQRRTLHALLCTAVGSRHQFVWPCLTTTMDDVIEGLEAAWQFFGGVFRVVVCDNLKPVIDKPDPLKPKVNPTFLEYAQSRGFDVDACRVRRPQDKPRVERQVPYARCDWFAGERFGSLQEARDDAARWCIDQAGQRRHGTTGWRPLECFEANEQPHLLPAPTEPYDRPQWHTVTLGRDCAVLLDHSLYSVPHAVAEGELDVRLSRSTVKLYRHRQLVKVHARQRPGQHAIDANDLPPGKAELATRDGASLQRQADAHGPHVGEYVRRLLAGPLPWTRMRRVYALLGLARRHGSSCTEEACARALELDVVEVKRIKRMLEQGLVQRGVLVPRPPPPSPPDNVIRLRFARRPSEFRTKPPPDTGEPDASA